MIDLTLTDDQTLLQRTVRDLVDAEIAPRAEELDRSRAFPWDNLRRLAELGLMGMFVSEEYGGAGASSVDYVVALEEVSRGCASTSVTMSVHNSLASMAILRFGNDEQRRRYLPDMAAMKKLGAFSLSEPHSGSDAAALTTTAARDGDAYVLNGNKIFVTSGRHADVIILFATVDREKRAKGVTAFLLEKGTPGFAAGKDEEKMGVSASSTNELILRDVRLPVSQRLGDEGQGFKIAMSLLDGGRIGIATQAVGIARAAFERSLTYARERKQFNQPIAEFQAIQWMLSDMATQIDAARLLVYRAAALRDQGAPFSKEAAMAKLFASEMVGAVTSKAVQIHGGYGYMRDYQVERHFRDAKVTQIYEGTSEVQRLVIAGHLLSKR